MGLLDKIVKTVVKIGVINTVNNGINAVVKTVQNKTEQKRLEKEEKIQELLITNRVKRIVMPYGFRYFKGKNYIEVKKELVSYGFQNIKCSRYKSSLLRCDNTYKVIIGGISDFWKKDVFYSNEKVFILYW